MSEQQLSSILVLKNVGALGLSLFIGLYMDKIGRLSVCLYSLITAFAGVTMLVLGSNFLTVSTGTLLMFISNRGIN